MIKKQSSKYESPFIKMLPLETNDIVTTSGDNFLKWGWDNEKPYNDEWFN